MNILDKVYERVKKTFFLLLKIKNINISEFKITFISNFSEKN
jgi:hypothetical protein